MRIRIKATYLPEANYRIEVAGRYSDGSLALDVRRGGALQARATVYLAKHRPAPGHVIIKSWSENEGLLDALIGAQVIEPPVRAIPTGYVIAHECRLTTKALDALNLNPQQEASQ